MGMNENTTLFILEILLILVFIIHLVLEITNNKGNNNDVIICDSRMMVKIMTYLSHFLPTSNIFRIIFFSVTFSCL